MTPFRLYDSMRRQKVAFEPLVPGKVGMYVCGPTTYDTAHIGHAYSAIAFDTIRRSLEFLGWRVTYVRNVTDVDDKIIKRANELGENPVALSARFTAEYNRDMAQFNVRPPDIEPKVSTHIPQIVALIERLIARGHAYVVDGDVYYAVDSFPAYGNLSGQTLDQLLDGVRIEVDARKRSPADFALWKSAKPSEPSWHSPWGPGRPGWHIECSAMTVTHLGATFDLHGGGKDLIFPHHENEIAQSQGAAWRWHVRALLAAQRLLELRRRQDVEVARQRVRAVPRSPRQSAARRYASSACLTTTARRSTSRCNSRPGRRAVL